MLRWISRNHPAVFLHLVLGGGIAEVMVADAALVVKCIAVITAGIRRSCMLYQLVVTCLYLELCGGTHISILVCRLIVNITIIVIITPSIKAFTITTSIFQI